MRAWVSARCGISEAGDARVRPYTRSVTVVRPDPVGLWPAYTLFPLAGLAIFVFGTSGGDPALAVIGFGLLAANAAILVNLLYFTTLTVERDEIVYRSIFGLQEDRVPIGALQRIDAKRYPGSHSGWSAPHFVARGRASTVKVNTKVYKLREFTRLLAVIRAANPRVELDEFWARVAAGEDVPKDTALTPHSRY